MSKFSNFQRDQPIAECILEWDLPPAIIDRCDAHFILHWPTEYFFHKNVHGVVGAKGQKFFVSYNGTDPAKLFKYKEVIISFRKLPKFEYGWALVRAKLGTEKV